jgi:hypothetical protein
MTQMRYSVLLAIVLLCCAAPKHVSAQFHGGLSVAPPAYPPPSVLSPDPSYWWIGPQIGVNINSHAGDFITELCDCRFDNGSGAGISVGLELGHMLSPWFGIALKAVYNDLGADYSYQLVRDAQIITGEIVPVDFERRNRVELGYLMLNPVLQLYPVPWAYLFLGPGVGVNTAGTTTYTLAVVDERYELAFEEGDERVVEEDSGEIPGLESLRMDMRFGIGANLRLGRSLVFSPEVSYNLPLTTISSDDNWKAEAIHLLGVFKFEL